MAKSTNKSPASGPLPLGRLTMSALFTALTAVLAQFAVPVPFSPVPFTGQVLAIFLAGSLLGKRAGFLSVSAYLLLGAAGAPVFSLARGGLHMLTGPSGGYLWGFLPAVYILGLIVERIGRHTIYNNAAAMLAALVAIYTCGALQLGLIMGFSASQAILAGVIPFLPLDLLKAILAASLKLQLSKHFRHTMPGRQFV